MTHEAWVELLALDLQTQIGTYGPHETKPDKHLLDLILKIDARQVLITEDSMQHVFDYDPLVIDIEKLAADGHYETQERLMTRIAEACANYPAIKNIDMKLRKSPVRQGTGSLGIRLFLDEHALAQLRLGNQLTS
jgi:dihydroneopterin aldolase